MKTTRRFIAASALAVAVLCGIAPSAGAKPPSPPHQTLKTIAASVAQAKVRDATPKKVIAPSSLNGDVALLQQQAADTVMKANTTVNAAAARGDTADEWANIATLYSATATLDAANKVAGDLVTPPPPTTTTTLAPTTTAPTTTTTTTVPSSAVGPVGVYNGSVSSALSLGSTLGLNPLTGYSYYCDGTSWSSISSCGPAGGLPTGTTLLVGVDLTPGKTGLSAVAGNVSSFSTLGKHFVGTKVIFRVGWEFDGSWMPWGTGANGNIASQFAPASALAINAIKAADPTAQFDFSSNTGSSTLAQLKVYMGNNAALYNYIGGDHYDSPKSTTGGQISAMTASITLASQLNKPFSLGEWGLNGADDTKFIAGMCQAIYHPAQASSVNNWPSYTTGPTSYFNFNGGSGGIDSVITNKPNSLAEYKADCHS